MDSVQRHLPMSPRGVLSVAVGQRGCLGMAKSLGRSLRLHAPSVRRLLYWFSIGGNSKDLRGYCSWYQKMSLVAMFARNSICPVTAPSRRRSSLIAIVSYLVISIPFGRCSKGNTLGSRAGGCCAGRARPLCRCRFHPWALFA